MIDFNKMFLFINVFNEVYMINIIIVIKFKDLDYVLLIGVDYLIFLIKFFFYVNF